MQRQDVLDLTDLETALTELETQAQTWLTTEGIAEPDQQIRRAADLRYANQGYDLTVPVPAGPVTPQTLERAIAAFHTEHHRLYTYASPELPVDIVNLRVTARGPARLFTPPGHLPTAIARWSNLLTRVRFTSLYVAGLSIVQCMPIQPPCRASN